MRTTRKRSAGSRVGYLALFLGLLLSGPIFAEDPIVLVSATAQDQSIIKVVLQLDPARTRPVLLDRAVAPKFADARPTTVLSLRVRDKNTEQLLKPAPLGALDMAGIGAGDILELLPGAFFGWSVDLRAFPWLLPLNPGGHYAVTVCVQSRLKTYALGNTKRKAQLVKGLGFTEAQLTRGLEDFSVCSNEIDLIGESN